MKIQFVSNSGTRLAGRISTTVINPAYFYLQAYYILHGLNPNVEWLENEWFTFDPMETQLERIISKNPDIVAFSIYVWNFDFQFKLMKKIRERLPKCIIVAGGPQLTAHKNKDFFEKHPYIDYVCYGDGEEAFQILIDKLSGYLPEDTELVNMIQNLHPGYKLYPYKLLTDQKYFTNSPIMLVKDKIVKSVEHILSCGVERDHLLFVTEFARGCMYSCSFCDWSQNLTKKVKRRTYDWKEDIDFFYDLNIAVRESDANFGQFKEDLDIFNYALSLYKPERNFRLEIHNTPKLKKDVTFYIMSEQMKRYEKNPNMNRFIDACKLSLQDINEDILANINRPSVPWEEQKKWVAKFNEIMPEGKKHNIMAELILGLPGQTPERVSMMILELVKSGVRQWNMENWAYLENSPAAEKEYIEKFNLKWGDVIYPPRDGFKFESLDKLFDDIAHDRLNPNDWTRFTLVTETNTMNLADIMQTSIFLKKFRKAMLTFPLKSLEEMGQPMVKILENVRKDILEKSRIGVEESLAIQEPYAKKYGFYIYGLIDNETITSMWQLET